MAVGFGLNPIGVRVKGIPKPSFIGSEPNPGQNPGEPPTGGAVTCPAGYYDGGDGYCYPQGSTPPGSCPTGFAPDINGNCVPVSTTPVSSTPAGSEEGPIYITVNNAETIGQQTIAAITQAIQTAINQSVQATTDAVAQVTNTVTQQVGGLVNSAFGWVKDALAWIGDHIKTLIGDILNNLPAILKSIGSTIANAVQDLKNVLVDLINKIGPTIDAITKQIQTINDTLLKPISTLILTTMKDIQAVQAAIHKDLTNGITGLLSIPGDLSGILTSWDATLQRTVEQLGEANKQIWGEVTGYGGQVNLHGDLGGLNDTWKGLATKQTQTTFTPTAQNLAEPSFAQDLPKLVDASNKIAVDLFNGVKNMLKDPTKTAEVLGGITVGLLAEAFEPFEIILFLWEIMKQPMEIIGDLAAEIVRKQVPLTKLDPGTLQTLIQRGFITDSSFQDELATQGYDATRISLLKELTVFLIPIEQALDMWARGIIGDDDLNKNLQEHGIDSAEVDALKVAFERVQDVGNAVENWKRGLLDDSGLDAVLDANRYSDNEKLALKNVILRPLDPQLDIQGRVLHQFFDDINIADSASTTPPPDFIQTVQSAGGGLQEADRLWITQWNTYDLGTWVQLYFRGVRTLTELQAKMKQQHVPQALWDDFIQVNRPLIPFRSVPSYVKAGVLTDAEGRTELAAHGFDLDRIDKIMEYVSRGSTTATTAAANTVASLSIANARTLFDDGAITQDQYIQVLEAHKYDPVLAQAQAKVDQINAHTKQQKQTLADLQAEVQAGVETLDNAIQQLQQQGFTATQIATFQVKATKALKVGQKHPSIAELDKFFKAQLITIDQYKAELQAQGWLDPWLTAFIGLIQTPTPTTIIPGTPTP